LAIYDALGRTVATLVNKVSDPGKYEIKFDAANLPSGFYLGKLNFGELFEVKRMVLLK
jgi:hypothetical protein